ncbi:MAG: alpha/beta fold hydrolase [Propionibacteriaceae bacterium]|jgi:pimeloyl-ACP methyl ester carboxylesterase|nr:alpha/beta fold hydrolase [Propionibacteriaceae bacterium]
MRRLVTLAVLFCLTGCSAWVRLLPLPDPSESASPAETASGAATTMIGDVAVHTEPGTDVDRPTYPDTGARPDGFADPPTLTDSASTDTPGAATGGTNSATTGATISATSGATSAATAPDTSAATISATAGATIAGTATVADPSSQAETQTTSAVSDAGLAAYLAQPVDWRDCDGNLCAEVLVPLDYADPGAQAITISLLKVAATDKPYLGALFVNPGGPGGSGKQYVAAAGFDGLEGYDKIGWDPRGVGDSTPIACADGEQMDEFNDTDWSPDDEAERAAAVEAARAFAKSCWDNNGSYLAHLSTQDNARDLDLLRQLLGQDKLNYLGYSYGTRIGADYAELYGANAGRLVLDSAVDISGNDDVIQAMGFDTALNNFAKWCVRQGCDLGKTADGVVKTLRKLLDKLDAKPIKVGKRTLTQSLAAFGMAGTLYSGESGWEWLAQYVDDAQDGDGAGLLAWADAMDDRSDDGSYGSMAYALSAVNCLDDSDDGVLDAEQDWSDDQLKAPFFGYYFGPDYVCPLWPVKSQPLDDITGAAAPPLLVVGTTGDNATPYQQAVDMAQRLVSATLITYEGEGHGAFGGSSSCVDKAVLAYLNKGTVPSKDLTCK